MVVTFKMRWYVCLIVWILIDIALTFPMNTKILSLCENFAGFLLFLLTNIKREIIFNFSSPARSLHCCHSLTALILSPLSKRITWNRTEHPRLDIRVEIMFTTFIVIIILYMPVSVCMLRFINNSSPAQCPASLMFTYYCFRHHCQVSLGLRILNAFYIDTYITYLYSFIVTS